MIVINLNHLLRHLLSDALPPSHLISGCHCHSRSCGSLLGWIVWRYQLMLHTQESCHHNSQGHAGMGQLSCWCWFCYVYLVYVLMCMCSNIFVISFLICIELQLARRIRGDRNQWRGESVIILDSYMFRSSYITWNLRYNLRYPNALKQHDTCRHVHNIT